MRSCVTSFFMNTSCCMTLRTLGVHYYKSCNYSLVKEQDVNDVLTLFSVNDVLKLVN